MKKLTFKLILLNLLLIMPIFSFAAISDQDRIKDKIGNNVVEKYIDLFNACKMNGTDIDSCLSKFKAIPSEETSASNHQKRNSGYYCCRNVSGSWGEYAYIHGQDYCVPPC